MTLNTSDIILGIDIGTSGIRASLVETTTHRCLQQFSKTMPFPIRQENKSEQDPDIWIATLEKLLLTVFSSDFSARIKHIVCDATSSTVLLTDLAGTATTLALMYDDAQSVAQANIIKTHLPLNSAGHGVSSSLAKSMHLATRHKELKPTLICHQIDFIHHYLTGLLGITDHNNALKLGYNIVDNKWDADVESLATSYALLLPKVKPPGTPIGACRSNLPFMSKITNINPLVKTQDIRVYLGTTDSIAGFLASGAHKLGDATTSLGSTIAIKMISERPIFDINAGIYSHRLGQHWLVGGASNAGGAVLLKHFSLDEIMSLLPTIDANKQTHLNYYPLGSTGERFPIANPCLKPRLTPVPKNRADFLHAIIEGLADIERLAFKTLEALGSPALVRLFSSGGGTLNPIWMQIRALKINAKMMPSEAETLNSGHKKSTSFNRDASYGVTQLLSVKASNPNN